MLYAMHYNVVVLCVLGYTLHATLQQYYTCYDIHYALKQQKLNKENNTPKNIKNTQQHYTLHCKQRS